MNKYESIFAVACALLLFAFFAGIGYMVHAENMACIKAGGTMKERACHFLSKET